GRGAAAVEGAGPGASGAGPGAPVVVPPGDPAVRRRGAALVRGPGGDAGGARVEGVRGRGAAGRGEVPLPYRPGDAHRRRKPGGVAGVNTGTTKEKGEYAMNRLQGKVAFITGAGSGIAREAARLFTREGAKVVIAEIKPELGRASEQLVRDAGGDATFVETDVTKEESVKNALRQTVARY